MSPAARENLFTAFWKLSLGGAIIGGLALLVFRERRPSELEVYIICLSILFVGAIALLGLALLFKGIAALWAAMKGPGTGLPAQHLDWRAHPSFREVRPRRCGDGEVRLRVEHPPEEVAIKAVLRGVTIMAGTLVGVVLGRLLREGAAGVWLEERDWVSAGTLGLFLALTTPVGPVRVLKAFPMVILGLIRSDPFVRLSSEPVQRGDVVRAEYHPRSFHTVEHAEMCLICREIAGVPDKESGEEIDKGEDDSGSSEPATHFLHREQLARMEDASCAPDEPLLSARVAIPRTAMHSFRFPKPAWAFDQEIKASITWGIEVSVKRPGREAHTAFYPFRVV